MRRAWRWGAMAALAGGMGVCGVSLAQIWAGARENAAIAALGRGEDVAVPDGAPARLLAARGRMLLARGKTEAAQAVADRLAGAPEEQAGLLYAMGNVRLRAALRIFTQVPFRVVKGDIAQAKAAYRQAVQLDPGNWDARYNYTLAAALVRDTEGSTPSAGDEMAHERAAWPDIPGAPNGMP